MKKEFKSIFVSDGFFLLTVLLASIGYFVYSFYFFLPTFGHVSIYDGVVYILRSICVITMYITYRKHSKNIMKGIMGALLMNMVIIPLSWIGNEADISVFFGWISFVLALGLAFNHFVINGDRHSKPVNIAINQLLVILITINDLIWDTLFASQFTSAVDIIMAVIFAVSLFGLAASIVCVETKLDAYKLKREENGWTPDK